MRFEEKLRKQMLSKGFNQQKLARTSGVSDSEVSRILGGKSQPGLENALKLARAVGVSLDYLADEALDVDPARERQADPWERELLEQAQGLGPKNAVQVLQATSALGFEVALRRLYGLEMKPLIEVGRPPVTVTPTGGTGSTPDPR